MIAIADSGSTKTEWVVISPSTNQKFVTPGFNPYFIDSNGIKNELQKNVPHNLKINDIKKIYFFGAGCSSEERCKIVHKGLKSFFSKAEVFVSHDIDAAAKALFGNKKGIALILGTGSNSCVYNGREIISNIPALGYILGDEGSGAYFGLRLVKDFLNNEMPKEIAEKFKKEYPFDREYILDRVYKQPFPNRFLASYAPFLSSYSHFDYVKKIINEGFDLFFKRHVVPYPNYQNYEIGSVGSIGYYLSSNLIEIANKYGFKTIKIIKSPLDGLLEFYQKNL